MSAPVFCVDCGHAKAMHVLGGKHPCVLDGCACIRFVSPAEGQEIARGLREQMKEAASEVP